MLNIQLGKKKRKTIFYLFNNSILKHLKSIQFNIETLQNEKK